MPYNYLLLYLNDREKRIIRLETQLIDNLKQLEVKKGRSYTNFLNIRVFVDTKLHLAIKKAIVKKWKCGGY